MGMNVSDVLDIPQMVDDSTQIIIETDTNIVKGNWYNDAILKYKDAEVMALKFDISKNEVRIFTE